MTKRKGGTGFAPRNSAEWVSLIISVLLVTGVISTILALWLKSSDKPASFRVERGAARNEAGHYYLPITVINEGDETGAQVTVEGKLKDKGETAVTTFDFIPARSSARGVLIFVSDPAAAEVRVISYQQP